MRFILISEFRLLFGVLIQPATAINKNIGTLLVYMILIFPSGSGCIHQIKRESSSIIINRRLLSLRYKAAILNKPIIF